MASGKFGDSEILMNAMLKIAQRQGIDV